MNKIQNKKTMDLKPEGIEMMIEKQKHLGIKTRRVEMIVVTRKNGVDRNPEGVIYLLV